jgi:proteasome assembly chaperone (PAC2) family protein
MTYDDEDALLTRETSRLDGGTLVLAFSGWMDGGDVSTGTVRRLIDLLGAESVAEIDPEPFYIYNFPGSMELTALFRPHIRVEEGLIDKVEMPSNTFYVSHKARLLLFVGKEPNLRWRSFAACIFRLCSQSGIQRLLFVGSFGGSVPHTREPRLYMTCSDSSLLSQLEQFGLRKSDYEGPGSFTSYLMTQVGSHQLQMISLVAEIPGYLQGTNPRSIEAVTRRLAKILHLPLDVDSLRHASTEWELEVSSAIENNAELAEQVRRLEEDYDNDLLQQEN